MTLTATYAQVKPQAINLNFIHCPKCMYHTQHTAIDLSKGLVRCGCGFEHQIAAREKGNEHAKS